MRPVRKRLSLALALCCLLGGLPVRADWYVNLPALTQRGLPSKVGPFNTYADAKAWCDKSKIAPNITGSDSKSAPAPAAPPPAAPAAAPSSGITQEQLISAAKAAMPALQNAFKGLFSGSSETHAPPQKQPQPQPQPEQQRPQATAPTSAALGRLLGPPAAGPSQPAAALTGMDKIEYNSLILLARQAQQAPDLEQQKALLKQFTDLSGPFLQKHPERILLWQIRVVSAMDLNDPVSGYEAGQGLVAAGAADSDDPNLQQLLVQINLKGWFNKDRIIVTSHEFQIRFSEWDRWVMASRAKAALMQADPVPPGTMLEHLIMCHLVQPKSDPADAAAAVKAVDADIARMKTSSPQTLGPATGFEQYAQGFGVTFDQYREMRIWMATSEAAYRRLIAANPDAYKTLWAEAGVRIADPDAAKWIADDNQRRQAAQAPHRDPARAR